MSDQRRSQRTSHHASAASGGVPLPELQHAVATEPDTDAASGYGLLPRQKPLNSTAEQGDAAPKAPDSEPPARCTSDVVVPTECLSLPPSTATRTIANGESMAG